jgi:hypothetical protein
VGRNYAGILGSLAFLTTVTRGLVRGAGVDSTLSNALVCFCLFACVGYVLGKLAGRIVLDSVRSKMARELARVQPAPGRLAMTKN